SLSCFFFNPTATTEIYTLSLHDALPICRRHSARASRFVEDTGSSYQNGRKRSEEHTSELQSRQYLVCRRLLEKKNKAVVPLSCRRVRLGPGLFLFGLDCD